VELFGGRYDPGNVNLDIKSIEFCFEIKIFERAVTKYCNYDGTLAGADKGISFS